MPIEIDELTTSVAPRFFGKYRGTVASNVDPAEGDLTPMDPKDIALAAGGAPGTGGRGAATVLTPEAQENNQRLWWYLLCLGTLVLGVDTLLSNRLAKT